jgi:LytS/YehU family sensor histidine kinase
VDEQLDAEFIRIPPMLIQPHLENAIWHGLRHRIGPKQLELSIREETEGYLDVVVRDNGIGRARARALRAEQIGSAAHRSKGSALSGDRLALLKTIYPLTDIQVRDLVDDAGNACGTAIELRIPLLPHANPS